MTPIEQRLREVRQRIVVAERRYGREPASVRLLAVSKTRPALEIAQARACGQRDFGENYLQDALVKMRQLGGHGPIWHFIGRIQSNKTRAIAEHFDWAHSLSNARQAQRLNEQRPAGLPPLKVCVQVNVSAEQSKGGVDPEGLEELIAVFPELERLELRGLMAMPAPAEGLEAQRRPFAILRALRDRLTDPEQPLDTLSMGMSADLEAAIAEGATIVRIGTAIFGPRH